MNFKFISPITQGYSGLRLVINVCVLTAICASAATHTAVAQGLVYVEAIDQGLDANLSPGDPGTYPTLGDVLNDTTFDNTDDKWGYRSGGSSGFVWVAGDGPKSAGPPVVYETARELKQTISGLAPGSYDIYVAYWTNVNEDWSIAGGLTSGQQVVYNLQGANAFFPTATAGTHAGLAGWSTPPSIITEAGNRAMLLGKVGTATAVGGEISVFINDPPGQTSNGRRSWFDGVAYAPAGADVFLEATVNRTTGEIIIENATPIDFTIKSYSVNSAFGSLDATHWNTIADNPLIDPDPWTVTAPANPGATPFANSLAEQENAGGSGGALLSANTGAFNLGQNVWISAPTQDIAISLTLDSGVVVSPTITYTGTAAIPGDFNGDGSVTFADYQILSSYMHTDVSTLTFAAAYFRGDMTGNRRINYEDFEDFGFAYDQFNGTGAFEQLMGVPEPSCVTMVFLAIAGLLSTRRRGQLQLANVEVRSTAMRTSNRSWVFVISALVGLALNAQSFAVGVTGWAIDSSFGGGQSGVAVLTNAASNSPTLGDGTTDNARNTAIYASFPQVSLADKQQITLTGTANLSGITPASANFRFGMLYEGGPVVDTFGWLGFLNENSNQQNSGVLNSKNPAGTGFATATFASTVNNRGFEIDRSRDREFQQFVAGPYDFSMTIGRFGNELYVDSSLSNAGGFLQRSRYATESDPSRITYNYNRVGLLAGDGLYADQVSFGSIDVATSAINTLKLQITTTGPSAGLTKIVNGLGQSVNLNYYEISSATGALSLSGWDSLDADPNIVGTGWNRAGGVSGLILSETNLDGSPLGNTASLDLGQAFDPLAAQNLRFFYGLTDGTFVRGIVEYVSGGLDGDHNGDLAVNAADYVTWRKNPGNFGGSLGYTQWRGNFGATTPGLGSSGAVPEPATLISLILALICGLTIRRRC